jgi:filamentous hemagglutinin family protein
MQITTYSRFFAVFSRSLLPGTIGGLCILATDVQAQSMIPAMDGTGTVVQSNSGQFDISGGTQAGGNLFHSFQNFGLQTGETANFQASPAIQNILSRVVGGDASVINGLLQVRGGNANLFLINPAGIVFGRNASLNLPAAFSATTANAIGFEQGWFNAVGGNDWSQLGGNPTQFAFTTMQPGAIVNAANLELKPNQSLTLLGGTVLSMGSVSAGNVNLTAVAGNQLVRITSPGYLLGLELPVDVKSRLNSGTTNPSSLAALMTGGDVVEASQVIVSADGQVQLVGGGGGIEPGDVVAQTAIGENIHLNANRNISLINSELRSTQALNIQAKDTVIVRDSVTKPVSLLAGKDLVLRGDRGIDILALNHPGTPIQSGGNLSLISDGDISGDAHFASGGTFSMRNTTGGLANFKSLYDPVISAEGDVVFGDYTGVSLKVEAKGSITAGNITITGPDTSYRILPDWDTTGKFVLLDRKSTTDPALVPTAIGLDTTTNDRGSLKTRTTFSAQAGQVISFDWNFVTTELPANNAEKDTATFTLTRDGGAAQSFTLANFDDTALMNLRFGGNTYSRGTGDRTFSTTIGTAGNYTLEFGVEKQGLNPGTSGLVVKSVNPVPIQISDNSLLAANAGVILRSGVTNLENPPNLPQLNIPTLATNFTAPGAVSSRGDITVGNITANPEINFNQFPGSIMINATGKVKTGNLVGGSLELLAGGEIQTGEIRMLHEFGALAYPSNGNVTLKNTDGKIIIDFIRSTNGGDITIDAYDGFQARKTTPVASFTNQALAASPASIVTRGKISIQHGGQPLQMGLGIERDASGAIIYRVTAGARAGERVFLDSSNPAGDFRFVYADGTAVTEPAEIRSVPFDPTTVPADTNYTAGAIFIGGGFNETLYGAFQDQQLAGSGDITIAATPRPPKPTPAPNPNPNPNNGEPVVANGGDNPTEAAATDNSQVITAANSQTNAITKKSDQCPNGKSGGATESSTESSSTIPSGATTPPRSTQTADPCAPKQGKNQDAILKIDPALLKP